MKTTIEISDLILRKACEFANREGVRLRTLFERGPQLVVAENKEPAPFKLRRATFAGRGMQEGLHGTSWEEIRALSYQDRGD